MIAARIRYNTARFWLTLGRGFRNVSIVFHRFWIAVHRFDDFCLAAYGFCIERAEAINKEVDK